MESMPAAMQRHRLRSLRVVQHSSPTPRLRRHRVCSKWTASTLLRPTVTVRPVPLWGMLYSSGRSKSALQANAADKALLKAIELAKGFVERDINKELAKREAEEQLPEEEREAARAAAIAAAKARAEKEAKWVSIRASHQGTNLLHESEKTGLSLADYLFLPVEEYSLLDPRWVQRAEDGRTFVLTLPLRELIGADFEPQIWISVDVDRERGRVSFIADRAKIGFSKEIDAAFDLHVKGELMAKDAPKWRWPKLKGPAKLKASKSVQTPVEDDPTPPYVYDPNPAMISTDSPASAAIADEGAEASYGVGRTPGPAPSRNGHIEITTGVLAPEEMLAEEEHLQRALTGISQHEREVLSHQSIDDIPLSASRDGADTNGIVVVGSSGASLATTGQPVTPAVVVELEGPEKELMTKVEVRCDIKVLPPLSVVPGPLISTIGGLVAKAAMQAMLPQFLQLLAADYRRWVRDPTSRDRIQSAAGSLIGKKESQSDAAGSSGAVLGLSEHAMGGNGVQVEQLGSADIFGSTDELEPVMVEVISKR